MTSPAGADGRTRVLIVDDQHLLREGLETLLSLDESLYVVGAAASAREALDAVARLTPHVVLMDIRMPGVDGIAATRALRHQYPDVQVLMLTTFDDADLVRGALQAGASGYVLKDTPSEQLARDLHAVRAGGSILSPSVARQVISALVAGSAPLPGPTAPPPSPEGRESLSEREREVLQLAARGLSNREIGARLYITEGTVKNHVSAVLSKLGVRDRTQAVLLAREQGLI